VGTSAYSELFDRALGAVDDAAADDVRGRILTAAREQFRISGIRRSSIEDVARRAGISRITVYRRFATKDALVEEVLLAELRDYFEEFRRVVKGASTAAERVVEGFALSLRAARQNSLAGGLMATEPQVMVQFLAADGRVLQALTGFVAGQLRLEQEAGEIPADVDPRLVAELMARVSLSFFLTPDSVVDLDDPEQVRDVARRLLAPLVARS
jgi:TetR/AcrR family transcriptional repressor of uid operon